MFETIETQAELYNGCTLLYFENSLFTEYTKEKCTDT